MVWIDELCFEIGFNMICHHNCVLSVWIAPSSDHVLLKKTDKQFFVSQIEVQEDECMVTNNLWITAYCFEHGRICIISELTHSIINACHGGMI